MAEPRTQHPYHMHDAIFAQPDCIARVLREQAALIERAAEAAAARRRILFAGIGTSYNAAQLGALFLRHLSGGRALAQVEQSFEMVHYRLALGVDDAVVLSSHRGWKNFSVEALKAAKAAGALTIAVTGELGGEGMGLADYRISTCEQEISFAHTKSYSTALAALALFAVQFTQRRRELAPQVDLPAQLAALDALPDAVRGALDSSSACSVAAHHLAARPRLIFTGAGPHWVTAREAALKVKETSYLHAEGLETEEFLHGPLAEMDSRASLVAFLAGGPGDARLLQALQAAGKLGVHRVAVVSRGVPPSPAEQTIELPAIAEWLSAFTHLVAAQLLSYHLALARGTNPDTGRQDQPDHARAHSLFKL
jgi:glucosamine--fructose-6-phosphate aminotransferase (isomerizing)